MINTGEFRNLIREIVRDEIGDKSLYKIGEVASIGDKVTVIFSGEAEPSQKQYTYLKSYSPGLGDRVILMKDKGTYVVLGKIGERGGGITFGEHLAASAGKHIAESDSNANGRYVKFDDGTQICWKTSLTISYTDNGAYIEGIWNYPASFISQPTAPAPLITKWGSIVDYYGKISALVAASVTNSIIRYILYRTSDAPSFTSGHSATISSVTIGRWK